MRHLWPLILLVAALSAPAHAQSNDMGVPDIMKPEPWLPPKYKSPRGLPQRVQPVQPMEPTQPRAAVPPPLVVPSTGAVLPNLPAVSPAGPGGRESYQDRAARCAHQASAYGEAAGDRTSYINSCINQ